MKTTRDNQNYRRPDRLTLLYFLFCLAILTACAGGGMASYTGRLAKPENMVALSSGDTHELQWQTGDLMINAMYALELNQLELAGIVQLQSKLTHYPIVEYLRISAHALDGEGIILSTYPLWTAGHNAETFFINWAFQRSYALPEGTRAVTFSYRGRMRDGGGWGPIGNRDDGGGISWDFWHTP
jgi:hypothetical protein